MDLLMDVDTVLELCIPESRYHEQVKSAKQSCLKQGCRVWLYVGSVQRLSDSLRAVFLENSIITKDNQTVDTIAQTASERLTECTRDICWLASLAGEGNVFAAEDIEAEQLLRAIERFPTGSIKILTQNRVLLRDEAEKAISPEKYCEQSRESAKVAFIDLKAQQDVIRSGLEKNIHKVLHHGRYILGPEVQELETQLADYVGVKHAVGVSSGTDALLMVLMALGVGPGDAVFTSPFTFIATAEIISLLGATPVFVDIDPRTYNLDPAHLAQAIKALEEHNTESYPLPENYMDLTPKAVIPVDMFGLPADYDPILKIADEKGLFVLEDAAQGLGGVYKGRKAGSLGHAAATSFFPAKPFGCYGDGGAVFTDNDELASVFRSIRVHGKGDDKYDNIRIGLNSRLHTMQAAVLLAKFEIFKKELLQKDKLATVYSKQLLQKNSTLTVPLVPEGLQSAWAQYSVLAGNNRMQLQEKLKNAGIPTAVYYQKPLHLQTAYTSLGYSMADFKISEEISDRIFSLPMHAYINNVEYITELLVQR